MITKLFSKYPEIAAEIKEDAYYNYKKNIRGKMLAFRSDHLEEINKFSSYKQITVDLKEQFGFPEDDFENMED